MSMTGKQRIMAAINKEKVDRVPLGPPFQGYWALGLAGVKVKESIEHPNRAAEAQIAAVDACQFDALETMWDWLSPVEQFGCEVKVPDFGTIPTWTNIVDCPEALDKLEIPDPKKDYRLKASLQTTEILTKKLGKEKFTILTLVSPFTLAGELRGVETMMLDSLMDPDFERKIIERSTEALKVYIGELVRSDADGVILCDPTASGSLISKEDFVRFSQPYMRNCGRSIKEAGKRLWIHICGDTSDRLPEVMDVGADVFSLDYQVDLAVAMERVKGKQTLLGNVKPAHTLFSGTPEDVRKESEECILKAGKKGFILGAGCDIAPGTPLENVEVWKKVVAE